MFWFVLRAARDLVNVGQYQGLRKFEVGHDSACVDLYGELSVYLHASSLFKSRVCNFMCLHVSKATLNGPY